MTGCDGVSITYMFSSKIISTFLKIRLRKGAICIWKLVQDSIEGILVMIQLTVNKIAQNCHKMGWPCVSHQKSNKGNSVIHI